MNLIDRFHMWRAERQVRAAMRRRQGSATASTGVSRVDIEGQIELARLAREIADDAARADIESECVAEQIRAMVWYDTSALPIDDDPDTPLIIARAVRYLDLRGRVIHHPVQKHLVRFER